MQVDNRLKCNNTKQDIIQIFPFSTMDPNVIERCSSLLLTQLFNKYINEGFNIMEVCNLIESLEGLRQPHGTRLAGEFERKPLKGFSHAHIFSAECIIQNLISELKLPNQFFEADNSLITQEKLKKCILDFIHGTILKRQNEGRLTGEWLIYKKHNGINYYLCLATHKEGRNKNVYALYDKICSNCNEFSFLFT